MGGLSHRAINACMASLALVVMLVVACFLACIDVDEACAGQGGSSLSTGTIASGSAASSGPAGEKQGDADALQEEDASPLTFGEMAKAYPVVPDPTTEAFIASICEQARDIGQERGIYASVMIAQAALESGSGSSGLSKPPYNNLFGIKGAYRGHSVTMGTSEDDGAGAKYDISAAFRSYPSVAASLQDYADLLTVQMAAFYAPARKGNAKTWREACDYLQGHYATDTGYASKLKGLITAYHLDAYDWPRGAQGSWAREVALVASGNEAPAVAQAALASDDAPQVAVWPALAFAALSIPLPLALVHVARNGRRRGASAELVRGGPAGRA